MTTSRSDQPPARINEQAAAQVQAERERLNITRAILDERRKESLRRPF